MEDHLAQKFEQDLKVEPYKDRMKADEQVSKSFRRNVFFETHSELFGVLDHDGILLDANQALLLSVFGHDDIVLPVQGSAVLGTQGFPEWARIVDQISQTGIFQHQGWFQSPGDSWAKPMLFQIRPIKNLGYALTGIDLSLLEDRNSDLELEAIVDPLTGAYNRRYIESKVEELIDRNNPFAIMLLDLDGFKQINDTMGHAAGDKLLRRISENLCGMLPPGETTGRIGGDEFIIVIEEIPDRAALVSLAEEIRSMVFQPVVENGIALKVSVSIGVSVYPKNGNDYNTLFRCADSAMYRSKRNGKNAVSFWDSDSVSIASQRDEPSLVDDLSVALREKQLEAYFQGIFDLQNGKLVGAEVLCRWNHPRRGLLEPAQFLPIAEHNGMISCIDRMMATNACGFIRDLEDAGYSGIGVFANTSAATASQDGFSAFIDQIVTDHKITPGSFGIELTESMALLDYENGRDHLADLHRSGVPIALDDFGTGFSSLSLLKDLSISRLKLDRSFLRNIESDPRDLDFLKTVITLGHALGADVVAEGIETRGQYDLLNGIGGVYGQGYFLGMPVSAKDFLENHLR